MRLDSGTELRSARVEMVPLIDAIFLLLAFFIFAMLSMVVQRGLPVDLPGIEGGEFDPRQAVVITITRDAQLFVDRQPATLPGLVETIRPRLGDAGDRPVWIRGDAEAPLGFSLRVLQRLRDAGAREVSFQTRDPGS